ncbi:hypothetical protein [uncultured Nocardioides sp.]|uniref:hypothetical protein n=1 Tax=uncultured Nocardioides sp. TaxID=198441 RepID=UPI0025EB5BF0|nr:hypothetical protein [uncultured Nocardioides sp.]
MGAASPDAPRLVLASHSDVRGVRRDHALDHHGQVVDAADGGPVDPALVHGAVLPPGQDTWRALPAVEQLGGWLALVLDRSRLDPTSAWSPLPDAPEERTGGRPVDAPGGAVVAAEG